jgi:addiction module RelE/StbE family toxin
MKLVDLFEAPDPPKERVATLVMDPPFLETWPLFKSESAIRRLGEFKAAKIKRPPEQLLGSFKDHHLKGHLAGYRECHLDEDACLIYTDQGDVVRLLIVVNHDEMVNKRAKALAKRLKKL